MVKRCAVILAVLALPAAVAAQRSEFSGGAYLFHYRPFGDGAPPPRTEVYAAFAKADVTAGRWRAHAELRGRDTRLREFFPSTVWIQEGWASFDALPATEGSRLTLRAGKIYQTLGRFWDGSFFGNVQYFDGLKLNPQFGVEAAGAVPLGAAVLGYTGQFLLDSDRISGALPGRDFETLDAFRNRDGVYGRVTLALPVGLTLGGTGAARGVAVSADGHEEVFHAPHYSADVELARGPFVGYVEWLRREEGDLPMALAATRAGGAATYRLAGAQLALASFHARYNFSRVEYGGFGRREWIHQPGIGYDFTPFLHGLVEVDLWRSADGAAERWLDRSVDVVLLLRF